jgi:signal transduction histidine kinase
MCFGRNPNESRVNEQVSRRLHAGSARVPCWRLVSVHGAPQAPSASGLGLPGRRQAMDEPMTHGRMVNTPPQTESRSPRRLAERFPTLAPSRWSATVLAYAELMELRSAARSGGLAWAALALIDTPCSAAGLVHRFQKEGASIDIGRATELLEELIGLGLVRISDAGESPRYIRTPLGDQLAASAIMEGGELQPHLAELERLRSELFSTVAHELRTPLTAIRTAVGLLLDPATRAGPDKRLELLQTIERNAERLQRLADTALELARFRAGQIRLQLRRFDARQLGDDVRLALGPVLDAKNQRLSVEVGDQPVWVFADHRRIERAILNLLSNAHKFSPPGSEIRFAVRRTADDVCWEVADDGHGIAEEEQPLLFERFFVSASDRAAGGSGLGLPIVLVTAQAHGGRVEVESELGRGSVFRLIVPAGGPRSHQE